MLMKNGEAVPAALADMLERDGYGLAVFMQMRPSCQKRYALRVTEGKDDDTMRSRLQSIIMEIHKYGRRHGVEG